MLPRNIAAIKNGVWLIDPAKAQGYLPLVISLLKGTADKTNYSIEEKENKYSLNSILKKSGIFPISEYGQSQSPESAPEGSIAIIGIHDVITKYDQECGAAGMMTKADILNRCDKNPNINAIVIYGDSPGGESVGMFQMVEALQNMNKPVVCFISDLGASAMYGIASSCYVIVANNNICEVGSIGTYCTIMDYAEALAAEGITLIEVYADASTEKNLPYKEALKGNTDLLKTELNRVNDEFINMVKTNRLGKLNITKTNDPFKGKLFFAENALPITGNGLIDVIGSIDDAIAIAQKAGEEYANSLNK